MFILNTWIFSRGTSLWTYSSLDISKSFRSWDFILSRIRYGYSESSGVVITVISMSPSSRKVLKGSEPYTVTLMSFFSNALYIEDFNNL